MASSQRRRWLLVQGGMALLEQALPRTTLRERNLQRLASEQSWNIPADPTSAALVPRPPDLLGAT